MAQSIKLKICYLYPDLMNTYGDRGNIIAIINRCKLRNITVTIDEISIKDKLTSQNYDLYFFGGGQDITQKIISYDLQKKKNYLLHAIENNAVLLSICGGYQLLQKYFKTKSAEIIEGIGVFNSYTIGSNDRMIQNILIELNSQLQKQIASSYQTTVNCKLSTINLIGFENHSGKTHLGNNTKPLGYVLKGSGNNGEDKTEGAIYKNAFGCYLHGSLLPKNPHFADFLITLALEKTYEKIKLKSLNDEVEWQAHKQAVNIIKKHY